MTFAPPDRAESPTEGHALVKEAPKNILLLYSYGHGSKGIDVFDDGLIATLAAGGLTTSNMYFEYLDLERNRADPQYAARLHDFLKKKYASHRIDAILTVQQPAANWLLGEGRDIAPDAPAVSVQAPQPTLQQAGKRRVVSVLANFDILGTLKKALDILPGTKSVLIVAGSSEADRNMATMAIAAAESLKSRVLIEDSGDMPLNVLLQRVAQLPPHSIVLFTQYNRDSDGNATVAYEVEAMVIKAANAPVFGLYDFNLHNGGLGGSIIGVRALGEKTGQLLLTPSLASQQPDQAVQHMDVEPLAMFDWMQIKRWGGDPERLAPDTIFVNYAPTFLERFGWYMAAALAFMLAQTGLIAALLFSRRRNRHIEQSLRDSEARYRTAFMVSPDAVNITRLTDGRYLEVSDGFVRMTGWSREEAVGKTSLELNIWAKPDDRRRFMDALERDGFYQNLEADFAAKDGHVVSCLMSAHLMTIKGERCLLSVTRDITERQQVERALAHEKALLEAIFNSIPDGIVYVNVNREVIRINPAFQDIFGFELQDLVGKKTSYFYESQAEFERQGQLRFNPHSATRALPYEVKYRRKNGQVFPGETLGTAIKDAGGSVLGFIGVVRDITERKLAQDKQKLAANVFTYAREGIIITDAQANIIDVNQTFSDITGFSRDEVVGMNPRILSSGRQSKEFYQVMWHDLHEKGHWYGEVWNRRKNGEIYVEMLTISSVNDETGCLRNYVALFSDITLQKAHEGQLEHIAHFDALTNLPNRVLLADRMHQAMTQSLRREERLAVAYLDLDGFKAVNDHHGHHIGDQLLVAISHRMKLALREGDTLARMGGDEFVAVLIDLQGAADAVPMLARLLSAAAQPVQIGDLTLQVSASLGVSFYPQSQELDADQLLRQADQAMYQAKVAGKNRYHVFDATQDNVLRVFNESLERLRLALERREFVLHYQPKVNMRSGAVIGAEALIRWQHPDKGLLAPAMFLHLIEDHPLAVALGEWVIDTALTQVEAWLAQGWRIPVSVNIGARQLQQTNFFDRLRALLAAHPHVAPNLLELEILETSALEDIAQVSLLIESCAAIGIAFALDDFGTGYSSLSYLKRLRVGILKIDQSFVRDMLDDPDDLAILEGVIGLAAAFKRRVIAEGVETVEHGTALLHLGCEMAQGFGIARPMPADSLPHWAATWQPDPSWSELPWMGGGE